MHWKLRNEDASLGYLVQRWKMDIYALEMKKSLEAKECELDWKIIMQRNSGQIGEMQKVLCKNENTTFVEE